MNVKETILNSTSFKPDTLAISDLYWKYLIRSILKGKNILLTGDSGSGKTYACEAAAKALGREDRFFIFNFGAMQDPKTSLTGTVQFSKERGTYFVESDMVRAIKTEGAIILLDELSRCHPDGINIMLTVLDEIQRYIRLDEKIESDIVKVAKNVSFLATANIGNEYVATRVMDRALLDRFTVKIPMEALTSEQEFNLIKLRFPEVDVNQLKKITDICSQTRIERKNPEAKITNYLSTRSAIEMAELLCDGFTLNEIAEVAIYPNFEAEGGMESEQVYVKQLVQKYIGNSTSKSPLFKSPNK